MELDNLPYLDIDIHFPHEKYQTKSHTDIPKKATYCHVARGKLFYSLRKQHGIEWQFFLYLLSHYHKSITSSIMKHDRLFLDSLSQVTSTISNMKRNSAVNKCMCLFNSSKASDLLSSDFNPRPKDQIGIFLSRAAVMSQQPKP